MGVERPILMSPPMARAVHQGTKTQTRRLLYVLRKATDKSCFDRRYPPPLMGPGHTSIDECWTLSSWSKAKPGDILVVREGFSYQRGKGISEVGAPVWYWADGNPPSGDWSKPKPSIHMPRWAARSVRELVGVRVERLQDISEADAKAEGIERGEGFPGWYRGPLAGDSEGLQEAGRHFKIPTAFPRLAYRALWESINGPGTWGKNPWVVVLTFKGPNCWYCGAAPDDKCQKAFSDVPCARRP